MGIEPIPRSPVGGRGFRSALVNAVRFGRYGSRVGRGPLTQGKRPISVTLRMCYEFLDLCTDSRVAIESKR